MCEDISILVYTYPYKLVYPTSEKKIVYSDCEMKNNNVTNHLTTDMTKLNIKWARTETGNNLKTFETKPES